MFDRLTLTDDLVDCRGNVLARRGFVVSPETIADAAQRASPHRRVQLGETPLVADLAVPLDEPAYAHLFHRDGARPAVERALRAAMLPDVLVEELVAVRDAQPGMYQHAFRTAAVTVRMLLAAVGEARALPDLAAAGLLHDLGMRHACATGAPTGTRLAIQEAHRIAAHPLLGAYHLACVLGVHPAVAAARSHHWRCGQGYPGLAAPPSRSIEVIAVASAFAALTQPRPYRSAAYDARGATDVLVAETITGHADANTVKLLVHALRGGDGDPRAIRFGVSREGHQPEINRYTPVEPPARSLV
jgi:HD-GYP domain-containing protein (c-di-GMP phosphodiesterase class II)